MCSACNPKFIGDFKLKKILWLLLASSVIFGSVATAQKQMISLGTGGETGVYYPTGGGICRIVNKLRAKQGFRCVLEATDGSVSNITRVLDRSLDLGLAQSNWIYKSYHEVLDEDIEIYEHKSDKGENLRTLLVLYPEYFTVLVPKESDIHSFDDIKGKRISIGAVGSGSRATMNDLLQKKHWQYQDFAQVLSLDATEQASALCEGRIDVMIYTVGHPSGAAREATDDCDSRLISVQGPEIEQLLAENTYYGWAKIPGAIYRGNIKSVPTFGVSATFFASSSLDDETAYLLVKAVIEQLDYFRGLHPAFSRLDPEQMVKGPFAAPLHKGAMRYFKEIGLID